MNAVLELTLTPEQRCIFFEAAAISGFRGEYADRDYLLYLLARDLTPVPGHCDVARGVLCQRLRRTPTPAFWSVDDLGNEVQHDMDGPEHSDGAGGKAPD